MPLICPESSPPEWSLFIPLGAAAIALIGGLITLWVNGARAERLRRRQLHARCLAAVLAYREMPFMIRRRRHEKRERSAERVRLAMHFSEVQTELATCQSLLAADGPDWLSEAYEGLVDVARSTAGRESHEAWRAEPIKRDAEMNMPELFSRLKPLNNEIAEFERQISWANKTHRSRRFRHGGPPTSKN